MTGGMNGIFAVCGLRGRSIGLARHRVRRRLPLTSATPYLRTHDQNSADVSNLRPHTHLCLLLALAFSADGGDMMVKRG